MFVYNNGKLSRAVGHSYGKGKVNRVVRTGTLAATEAADVAAMSAVRSRFGPLAATETADTAAFVGARLRSGTLAATEAADVAAFTGTVTAGAAIISGTLAATEAADVADLAGTVAASEPVAVVTRLGQFAVGLARYLPFEAKAAAEPAASIAITRLGQFGVGVARYLPFEAKAAAEPGRPDVQYTRLGAFGIGLARYLPFEAKASAEPAPPVFVGGGIGVIRPPRPFPVEGYGYGILPQLEGEAHGVVLAAGLGAGSLPDLGAELAGAIGAAGRSLALLDVKGAASGDRGQAGAAAAVLKELAVIGTGAAVVRGKGLGMIIELEGAAKGRHDDDEAAVAWLLAA